MILRLMLVLVLAALPLTSQADEETVARSSRIFSQVCAHCHARAGVAPVPGDASEWRERRAQGFDVLLANTVNGVRGMPPLGSCAFCSEADLRALVTLISGVEDPDK